MNSRADDSPYTFEPLGDRDRTDFSCGVPELDRYFLIHATQDARRKVAAPFVILNRRGTVLGYYTLSAYSVRQTELPEALAKKLPRYPLLPATLLGRLAVSDRLQGRKLGRQLLLDALYRSWRNTSEIASVGVVAEAINEVARAFYLHHQFAPMADHPTKVFLPMKTIERAFGG